jgi:hypothetical protein
MCIGIGNLYLVILFSFLLMFTRDNFVLVLLSWERQVVCFGLVLPPMNACKMKLYS